jgi:hypothetical protein
MISPVFFIVAHNCVSRIVRVQTKFLASTPRKPMVLRTSSSHDSPFGYGKGLDKILLLICSKYNYYPKK